MAERSYSSTEVVRRTGLTYRQLDYWDRSELLVPSVEPAHGSGSSRRYSADDLRRAQMLKAMLDRGISLQTIRRQTASAGSFWVGVADLVTGLRSLEALVANLLEDPDQVEVSA